MVEKIKQMRLEWSEGDAKRDAGLTVPDDLDRYLDILYGPYPENLLDVYCPEHTEFPLPTIVSIHGGGWFYGSKQLYSHYCMALAQRGFTVVNYDYRLAPEYKYPAPLEDACMVLRWMQDHGAEYHIDLNNVFVVGDSAGGQLAFQLLTMLTNPAYADLFSFRPPADFRVNACGLNCGCYFIPLSKFVTPQRMGPIFEAYFPEDYLSIVPSLKAEKYLTSDFPPAFVMSSSHDYLRMMAAPLHRKLKRRGVETILQIYGTRKEKEMGHVFHLNCRLEQAKICNNDQCSFFRAHMR